MAELPEAPSGILETPIGKIHYVANTADHVFLVTDQKSDALTIRAIPYSLSVHLSLVGGRWGVSPNTRIHMWRRDQWGDAASTAAERRALDVLTEAWADLVAEDPEILRGGAIHHLSGRISQDEEEMQTLLKRVEKLEEDRRNALRQLSELGYYGPNKQDWSARF